MLSTTVHTGLRGFLILCSLLAGRSAGLHEVCLSTLNALEFYKRLGYEAGVPVDCVRSGNESHAAAVRET